MVAIMVRELIVQCLLEPYKRCSTFLKNGETYLKSTRGNFCFRPDVRSARYRYHGQPQGGISYESEGQSDPVICGDPWS